MHDGLGQARCIVLHANRLLHLVDLNVAYAIDLANLRESPHCRLIGRCTVLIHHVKLCHTKDFTGRSPSLRVQLLNVLYETWAGEVLRTNQFAADDSALVDDIGLGEFETTIKLVGRLLLIEHGEQAKVFSFHVMLVLCEGFVAGDGDHLDLGHLLLKGLQTWHFFYAGSTPAGPEIQHDYFALKTLQVHGVLAVTDGKGGSYAANLVGECSSIAACGEGAG